ncbi:hypothetical protein [Chromobacterium sphagni]|uniref:Ferritin-like domain-containing protein n=1 Tax=Chromobacterium sphagni TaxID=1903179 RepID=A0A1S1WW10_9NEIS|nr:hypothetical protein [Chromobacterium sphagni]OHX11504.1 hypothetical protein BI347_17720 [Chromobacterium sphagni]OHX17786.1 hypothetical protein BI344_20500 [Chromobacterium sphagni]
MHDVASSTLAALREQQVKVLPHYDAFLRKACQAAPPLFGDEEYADSYRQAAQDPQWLAVSLITNAEREGDGASRLWNLAASTPDPEISEQIRQHAVDESRHARAYISMLGMVFPTAVSRELMAELLTLSPGYGAHRQPQATPGSAFAHPITADDLIQMNIAEIRTRIHHLLQRPMLTSFCAPQTEEALLRVLDSLLYDETRHIAYTACLIERFAVETDPAELEALMLERMRDFDQITRQELALRVFE